MNVVVWILQAVLGLLFAGVGLVKLGRPKEQLREQFAWVDSFSAGQVRLIGLADLLGGVGIVGPAAVGVLPWLTPLAAAGLAVLMALAVPVHRRLGELPAVVFNLVLLVLAVVVAVQRASTPR